MPLQSGTRVGPYEVTAQIGVGGMGEVYRATDTNLGRQVAIKVLPEAFAHDPDRLARFEREARTLASLNHPNIAQIHGLERSPSARSGQAGVTALVMELVEGPTLADRIAERAIPVDEALPIARQIAEALEAAHEQGIIHRDLKPANIKVRPDGTVKVLDFGLAKALEPAGVASASVSEAATITTPAMTQLGVVLGTAAYMSPEQARGKNVDRRTDIWAFGCVLYEMLTGKRAFAAAEITDTLALIITKDPDWAALSPTVPSSVRRLLLRILEKDPRKRLAHIGDARLDIDEALMTPVLVYETNRQGEASLVRGAPRWKRSLPWALAGALALVLVAILGTAVSDQNGVGPEAVRVDARIGANAVLATNRGIANNGAAVALSPDGDTLGFVARAAGARVTQLYVRRLSQSDAIPLAGTEGAANPFFSPDGQWLAFFADGKLKKVGIGGGDVVSLCDADNGRGGSWGDDGTIVFSTGNVRSAAPLARVSAAGGAPEPLTSRRESDVFHLWPQVLPSSRGVLYTASPGIGAHEDSEILVLPLLGGESRVLQRKGYHGRYLASGHLAYMREGTLFVAPFDLDRLEVTGGAVPVLDDVQADAYSSGAAQFSASSNGAFVYVKSAASEFDSAISWMDGSGVRSILRSIPSNWSNPAFSPDGTRLAFDVLDRGNTDVWIYDWTRDALSRITSDPGTDERAVWSSDGRRVVFRSTRDTRVANLYWQGTDGVGEVQRLTESPNPQRASSWDPTGRLLAFHEDFLQETGSDLMVLPIEGDGVTGWKTGQPRVFLRTPANERTPMFSPDGRWIAYFSDESGQNEVYVRPYPGPGGKWQISTAGGHYARWSLTTQELFFSSLDQRIMVASYVVNGKEFTADRPRVWSPTPFLSRQRDRSFDVHPDGKRIAVALPASVEAPEGEDHVTLIFSFFEELTRLVPTN